GLAQRAEEDDRGQYRERDGYGDDEGAPPAPEEKQDHGRGEAGRDERFADDAAYGRAHEDGLVGQRLHLDVRREASGHPREERPHLAHDRERGGGADLLDGQQHAEPPILADDVGL